MDPWEKHTEIWQDSDTLLAVLADGLLMLSRVSDSSSAAAIDKFVYVDG